jgi:hypothetical protein
MLSRSLKIMPSLRLKMFLQHSHACQANISNPLSYLNLSSRKRSCVYQYGRVLITTCEYINNINDYTTIAQTQYRKFVYKFFYLSTFLILFEFGYVCIEHDQRTLSYLQGYLYI